MQPENPVEKFIAELKASTKFQGAQARAKVDFLARENFTEAVREARSIEHPWYRCQSLVLIAEKNPGHPQRNSLLLEALSAAFEQSEPNRIVTVAFWPMHALVRCSLDECTPYVERLLSVIQQELHCIRRLDGLSAILQAVLPDDKLRSWVFSFFLETLQESHSWRAERAANSIAIALLPHDRTSAYDLIILRPRTRYTKKARQLLQIK